MSLINDALKRAGNKSTTPPGATPPEGGEGNGGAAGGGGFKLAANLQNNNEGGGSGAFVVVLVLIVSVVGGWFGWRWWSAHQKAPQNATLAPAPKTSVSASNAAALVASSVRAASNTAPVKPVTVPAAAGQTTAAKSQAVPPPPPGGLNPVERARAVLGTIKAARTDSDANAAALQTPAPKVEPAVIPPPPVVAQAEPPKPEPVKASPVVEQPPAAPVTWPNLKLQAVFYRLQGASARVNGKTVRAGDEVEGAKVVQVQRRSVTFRIGEETKEVTLK